MKVVVIGAGPAGLYAAQKLASSGVQVTLHEQRRVGEGITCGECIFDFFGLLKRPKIGLLYEVEDMAVRVGKTYSRSVRKYNRLWMLDRAVWQRGLAAAVLKAGATINENSCITTDRLRELASSHDFVIDCSGAPSLTGKVHGFTAEYLEKFAAACQYELEGDFSRFGRSLYFGLPKGVPSANMPGYYWIFPKSSHRANVGIGYSVGADGRTLPLWEKLHQAMTFEGIDDYKVLAKGGGFLPIAHPSSLVYGNILLAGDAAGVTSEFSGEGIDLACVSGMWAAEAILHGGVLGYEKRLNSLLKPKRELEQAMAKFFSECDYDTMEELVSAVFNKKMTYNPKVIPIAMSLAKLLLSWRSKREKMKFSV